MEEQREPEMNAIQQSSEFAQAGDTERAFNVLDAVLLRATEEKRTNWLTILCEHAAILAHRIGDRGREIHYRAQALPTAWSLTHAVGKADISRANWTGHLMC